MSTTDTTQTHEAYAGPERRGDPPLDQAKPPGGTALATAVGTGVATGVATAKAMNEFGGMGLNGTLKNVGNFTAMMVIVAMFYMNQRDATSAAKEDRQLIREEIRGLTDATRTLHMKVDARTASDESLRSSIDALVRELRNGQVVPREKQP